jgi:HEAT repeat protein
MVEVRRLTEAGRGAVDGLIALLGDPSWVVRRAVVAALARIGDPAVRPLCDVLAHHRTSEPRLAAAVDALVSSGGDVEPEVHRLARESTDPAVVCDVAQILGRRKSVDSVPTLAEWCADPDDNVAVAAIEALGRIGGSSAVAPLVAAVESGNFFRAFPAIMVLGQTGDPRAVTPLAARLGEPHYSAEAALALGRTGQLAAVSPLAQHLGGDVALVRWVARALTDLHQRHLDRFGDPEAVPRLFVAEVSHDARESLAAALRDAGIDDTVAVATVLGWLRDTRGLTSLLHIIDGETAAAPEALRTLRSIAEAAEPVVRDTIRAGGSARRLRLLPLLGARRSVVPELVLCLSDEDPAVRAAAADGLGRIGDPSAVGALFALLGDADARVAQAALGAVQSLGSDDAKAHALEAARSTDARVRRAALRVISYFGYPDGLDALLEAVADHDERIREAAAGGLVLIEDARASRALLGLATHVAAGTRAATMRALGSAVATPEVQDALVGGLTDGEPWVRYYACQSLGKLHVTRATELISRLLVDDAGQVRVAAVEAIAKLGGEHALEVLERASEAADLDVRRAALLGLGALQRPSTLPVLLRAAAAEDPTTRALALSAIAESTAPEALAALSRAVSDADPRVRETAFELLAARPGPKATRWLIEQLARIEDREQALTALASPVEGRIEGILATLEVADANLAASLVEALVRMRRAHGNAALESVLHIDNVAARRAAVTALGAMRTVAARKALLDASLADADDEVRRIASAAL